MVVAVLGAAVLSASAAHAARPTLAFRVFADTGHNMDGIVWTGSSFLYVENTTNAVWSAPAAGSPLTPFATMPNMVEETRCILSPGTHGFPPGVIFCHSPDNKIYELGADGSSVSVFATLPVPASPVSDGALAFDAFGGFGYQLVAATGRSGTPQPSGGAVYTVSATGQVAEVGSYAGPGADEITIAPRRFGSVGGEALLALDGGASSGSVIAMDAHGGVRTIASLPGGPNPIAVIPPPAAPAPGAPPAGLYVTNDINPDVYFAPASPLAAFAGDVIVGSENTARFWILAPRGKGFVHLAVRHNLRGGHYSLEGCIFAP